MDKLERVRFLIGAGRIDEAVLTLAGSTNRAKLSAVKDTIRVLAMLEAAEWDFVDDWLDGNS